MGLRDLSVEEMVQVSAGWVAAESPGRGALASRSLLASLLGELVAAHAGLLSVRRRPAEPRRDEIARQAAALDVVHDTLVRGIHETLTGVSRLSSEGASLLSLRDALLPEGVAGASQQTYRGQAGYAKLLAERLTPELRAQLDGVVVGGTSLLASVESWMDAGRRLGEFEEEATRIEQRLAPSTAAQVNEARLRWIRVVNALESLVDLAGLEPGERHVVLGSLVDARTTAEQRAARRTSKSAIAEADSAAAS